MKPEAYLTGLIVLAALSFTSPAAAKKSPKPPQIPSIFLGRWDFDRQNCQNGNGNWMTISATGIDEGEHSSVLVAIKRINAVSVRITMDNYGELTSDSPPGSDAYAGRNTQVLTLLNKGRTLRITTPKTHYTNLADKCPIEATPQ